MQRYHCNHSELSKSYYQSPRDTKSQNYNPSSSFRNSQNSLSYQSFPLGTLSRPNQPGSSFSKPQVPPGFGYIKRKTQTERDPASLASTLRYAETVYGLTHLPKMLLRTTPTQASLKQASSHSQLFRSTTPTGSTNTSPLTAFWDKKEGNSKREKPKTKQTQNEKTKRNFEERGRNYSSEMAKQNNQEKEKQLPEKTKRESGSQSPKKARKEFNNMNPSPSEQVKATNGYFNGTSYMNGNSSTGSLYSMQRKTEKPGLIMNIPKQITSLNGGPVNHGIFLVARKMDCIIQPEDGKGGLFVGSFEGAKDIKSLRINKINAVLTASGSSIIKYLYHDVYLHKIILAQDIESYDLTKHFQEAFDFIDRARKSTNVLVHCFAGVSRSVTLVVAYLMARYQWTMGRAMEHVRQKRAVAQPNPGFMRQLRKFENRIANEQERLKNPMTSTRKT